MELLVTLAIVAVLAWLTVPVAEVAVQRNKEQDLRHALAQIRTALDAYKQAADEGLIEVPTDASGYPPTLDVLVDGVPRRDDKKNRKLYFLRRIPRDPMAEQAGLTDAQTWGKRSYASEAQDPREGDDIYDVFSTSNKLGLNGVAYTKW
jgi:general secretion pathway protein G